MLKLPELCVASLLLLQPALAMADAAPAPRAIAPACASPTQSVAEKGFVSIGGIEQWVTVKGDSCVIDAEYKLLMDRILPLTK